jgi:hypothetical protein
MKRFIVFIVSLCLIVSVFPIPAFSAEPYELIPVDIINFPNRMEIRRIYELSANSDPARIPRTSFTRDNIRYRFTDIIRETIIGEETKILTEIETVDSPKNDIESILLLLPQTKEIITEDGFSGILHLNNSTIRADVSGYGSRTNDVSITRTYPNLYNRDSQYIPKTVTENNITYTLTNIEWRTDNTDNIDDFGIGNRFTAVASYSGVRTTSFVRGYIVTAEYTGEVSRSDISNVRYTVVFSGTEIEPLPPATTESEPETEPETETEPPTEPESDPETILETEDNKKSGFNWWFFIIPFALLAAALIAAIIYLYLKKRKEQSNYDENEENFDYDYIGNDYNDGGDSGDGDEI